MKKYIPLNYIFILIFIFSCKENTKDIKDVSTEDINNEIYYVFPDTVEINKKYNGEIKYKGILDSITTRIDDPKKYRSIYFYYLITKNKNTNNNYLKKTATDSLISDSVHSIPLFDITFNRLGVNYLDGVIVDEVMYKSKEVIIKGKKYFKTRIISKEYRATLKVVVVEKCIKPNRIPLKDVKINIKDGQVHFIKK